MRGYPKGEWEKRLELTAQLRSGEKTLQQIQQELRDFQNPDAAELRRYREREPLVQELVEAVMKDPSETPFDEYACQIVRFGSCITPASTDTTSEANAAGSRDSEPTK